MSRRFLSSNCLTLNKFKRPTGTSATKKGSICRVQSFGPLILLSQCGNTSSEYLQRQFVNICIEGNEHTKRDGQTQGVRHVQDLTHQSNRADSVWEFARSPHHRCQCVLSFLRIQLELQRDCEDRVGLLEHAGRQKPLTQMEDLQVSMDIDLLNVACDLIDLRFVSRRGKDHSIKRFRMAQGGNEIGELSSGRNIDEIEQSLRDKEYCKIRGTFYKHFVMNTFFITFANPQMIAMLLMR